MQIKEKLLEAREKRLREMEMELITNANKLVKFGLNYLIFVFDYNKQRFTTKIRLLKTTMSTVGLKSMFPNGLKN